MTRAAQLGVAAATALASALVVSARAHRSALRRLDRSRGRPASPPSTPGSGGGPSTGSVVAVAPEVGRAVAGAGRLATRAVGLAPHPRRDAAVGRAVLAGGVCLLAGTGPLVAASVAGSAVVVPVALAARRRARRRAAVQDEAPEVIELVRLGTGAGLNVRLALEGVTRHLDGLVAEQLRLALVRADRGDRLADALDDLELDGDAARPLVDALVASERDGAPLADALARVATDARTARRRRAEEAARRVPVQLLFPLVFCTLPAFVLLTVVPVLLRSLPTLAP